MAKFVVCKIVLQFVPTLQALLLTRHIIYIVKYRIIRKSLQNFWTQQHNNQDRHSRKEHINRQKISPSCSGNRHHGVLAGFTAKGQSWRNMACEKLLTGALRSQHIAQAMNCRCLSQVSGTFCTNVFEWKDTGCTHLIIQPMALTGLFVSQRAHSHSAGISFITH
jgi:hypothetical protein